MDKFEEPILITSPLLPAPDLVTKRLGAIWESGQLTNHGSQHKLLEEELKGYLSIPDIELFNNGTTALLLGIKALGLTGEVITTPFTFPATVEALDWNGLTPVFCDIEKGSLNIDAEKLESLITEKTSAILAVHVFGNPCDVEAIQRIADQHNLKVIYDAAHAFGSTINGKPVSQYGDMTMFSFHATKLFHTVEGGAIAAKSKLVNEQLRILRNFGIKTPEQVVCSGLNGKLNEVQAAVGLEVLPNVAEERKRRHQVKRLYEHELDGIPGIRIVTQLENEKSSYQYFVIEIDETEFGYSRDWVHEKLKEQNVWTRKYFYPLCSDFHWYEGLASARKEALPNAHDAVMRVLSMPFHGGLKQEEVIQICKFFKQIHNDAAIMN